MSAQSESLDAVRRVVRAFGADAERCVLAGAAAAATYALRPLVGDIRRTRDVDLVAEVRTVGEYHRLIERLRAAGVLRFLKDEPICRYEIAGERVDLMPIRDDVLGFSNRWYPQAFERAETYRFDADVAVRVITPPYFVATKIEAFLDPARQDHGDFLASHDLEDLLVVLIGVDGLVETFAKGTEAVHAVVRASLRTFLSQDAFHDAVAGTLPHAYQAEERRAFTARLSAAAQRA